MYYTKPLLSGRLIKKYKRFLADIRLDDGREITAHIANPGSMLGLTYAGMKTWVEPNNDPKRKLKFSWKIAQIDNVFIGVDTTLANHIVKEALNNNILDLGYNQIQCEVKYGKNSRIDFLLSANNKPDLYLEIKSVTLSRSSGHVEFPDSKTERGTKHMQELTNMIAQGHHAAVLFLVQRTDATYFTPAADIDPTYANALYTAYNSGVKILCYDCEITPFEIRLGKKLCFVAN